jgi:phage-related protein
MTEQKIRTVILYEHYFTDFFQKQRQKVKDKILWTIRIIETQPHLSAEYFKHIENTVGLYEIRVHHGGVAIRIFCFFDSGRLIVLGNAFHKKTQKTPAHEIKHALKIRAAYEKENNPQNTRRIH